jgi:hypothetical protein
MLLTMPIRRFLAWLGAVFTLGYGLGLHGGTEWLQHLPSGF